MRPRPSRVRVSPSTMRAWCVRGPTAGGWQDCWVCSNFQARLPAACAQLRGGGWTVMGWRSPISSIRTRWHWGQALCCRHTAENTLPCTCRGSTVKQIKEKTHTQIQITGGWVHQLAQDTNDGKSSTHPALPCRALLLLPCRLPSHPTCHRSLLLLLLLEPTTNHKGQKGAGPLV